MKRFQSPCVLFLLTGIFLAQNFGSPSSAEARKKRVVILPFSGPGGSTVRSGVIRGLKRRVKILSTRRYLNASNALDVERKSAVGRTTICAKLRCDAVIAGSVKRRRRRYRAVISVLDGGSGKTLGRRARKVRSRRHLRRAGISLGRAAGALARRGKYPKKTRSVATAPTYQASPTSPNTATGDTSATNDVENNYATADTSDIPSYSKDTKNSPEQRVTGETDDELDGEEETGSSNSSEHSLIEISAGIGLSARNYVLNSQNTGTEPNKYEGGMYPEFILRLDAYPLAHYLDNLLRGIGIGVSYARHLTISTKPQDDDSQTVDSSSQEILLDLKWRWLIFNEPYSPFVILSAGYGMRDFDLGANDILTSFNYRFVRIGLDGGWPLWSSYLAITAGFDARPLLKAGQEAVDAFGNKTGGFGFAGRVGLSGTIDLSSGGIFYFANFEYLRFTTDFEGLEPGIAQRAGYPDRFDATAGTDRYIRFWAGAGYRY